MADLAARRGVDKEIGLVQQVINYSPEITTVMGRTVPGTFTEAKVQISIPKGGAFRAIGQGAFTSAGTYEKRRFNAYPWDSQLAIDELELVAANQVGDSLGDLQADEVSGALMDKAIKFSQQFYEGQSIDAGGFPGLQALLNIYNGTTAGNAGVIDSRTGKTLVNYISAGSASPATDTVWYAWVHPQGVHFIFGGDKVLDINPWVWQYMPDPTNPAKRLRMSVCNISGWIGLCCAHPWAVACIKNIDAVTGWTDAMSSKLHALLPVGVKPTHCFCTKRTRALLQQSRTVTLFGQAGLRPDQPTIAPLPQADIEGVPLVVTDGIQLQKAW
jgi:hypothetical protein